MHPRRFALRRLFRFFPLALLALTLRAQPADPAGNPQSLGLRAPTAEEEERMRVLAPRAVRVLPNALALKRVNDERVSNGLAPLSLPVVPDGGEIIFTPGVAASTAPAVDPGTPPTAADAALPSAADNSLLAAFPPIRNQGSIGSCACFSSVYYMSTFMVAQARGLNVRNDGNADKFSPKFVYPFVNGGADGGSWFTDIFEMLLKHGAPTLSDWPYSGANVPSSYLEWPVDGGVWRRALENRMDSSYTITGIDTEAGLNRLKTALANGKILVWATNVNGWDYTTASDDPSTTADNALVGRPVVKVMRVHSSGHAMTVVGYNDNLWVDLNKNGRVDPGEKGALRIANSWGPDWKDGGFIWVAYDALRVTSAVADVGTDITSNRAGSTANSQKPVWDATVYGLNARTSYTPQLVGSFTLRGVTARKELRVTSGRGTAAATNPATLYTPGALVEQGGSFSFNGTGTPVDGTFVFDFSELRQEGANRYFLTLRDTIAGDSATLTSFQLLDGQGNVLANAATGVPATVDASSAIAYHSLTVATGAPSITSALSASGTVNAAFTYVIVASNLPTAFTAPNLPSGLVLNSATGAISGTPQAAGTFSVAVGASNALGADTRTLVITIAAAVTPPVISSPAVANGTSGVPFSYQTTASNSPTSYGVNGSLPAGLTVNSASGLIAGTPVQTGTFNVQISATNAGGTSSRALAITIAAPTSLVPVIISPTTAGVGAGNLFNYRIQATNTPTAFGAQNLPSGLALDSITGVITGRVSLARSYQITLSATNATGTGFSALTLEVSGNSSFGPANDNFLNRIVLSGASVATTGSNANATAEAGEPAHAGSAAATSVWWSWTAPSSGTLTVSTAGSVPAMRVALYTGAGVSTLTALAPSAAGETTSFTVVAGTVYHLAVDSIGNNTGSIALALALAAPPPSRPANDNFAAAAPLTGASATATAITNAATAETGEPAHGDTPAAKSVWYRWTAPAAGRCVVSTRGSDYDTMLSVYTGTALNTLTVIARDDDSGGNLTSEAGFTVTAGTTYNFAVDGYAGVFGNLAFSLAFTAGTGGPANDNFASSTILTGSAATFNGSTVNASREGGEPAHAGYPAARSVWFRWVAPSSGLVTLSTSGSAFDTVLAVYTGSALASLAPVASNDDSDVDPTSLLTFTASSGTAYSFAIDGYDGATGNYALRLTLASGSATNNAFAAAAPLATGVRTSALSTAATAEPGEPAHFTGNPAAKSLWWRWTAPVTGFISITTAGSNFDTVLAVYTGSALASLTRIAENDDASDEDSTSTVFFRAVAGRTYFIAVDGYSGGSGTIALILTQAANASTVYATDFENFAPGTGQLVKQDQWNQISAPSSGNAQGILPQGLPGQGRAGYLGYGAPDFSATTSNSVYVFRPLNFDPVAEGAPLVQIRADINLIASTNGRNDAFRLSLYSRDGTLLGGFYFDTATRLVSTSDGSTRTPSTFTFTANTRYTLLGTFNFATRRWTARINSTELVADSPFAVGATTADVGDFDFVWVIANAQRAAGDNFIIFDNLAITADSVPTSVPVIQLPATPPVGSVANSISFAVTAANGPISAYSAAGLPPGLTINPVTGLVSGTPTQVGTFNASFTATNSRGSSTVAFATFTILAGPPVIVSAGTASARLGQPFSFQITATNAPRAFGVRGTAALPSGLTLDAASGMIAGTPRAIGTYRLTLAADNAVGTGLAQFDLAVENPDISRLVNLSVRSTAGTGAQTLIVGFSISGSGTKQMLIRGVGPTLASFGVPGVLADPLMRLFNSSGAQINQNDDWGGTPTLTSAFTAVGAFALPAASKDAALLVPLPVGSYSAQIITTTSTGVALVEGYDADAGTPGTRLSNLSVRSVAGTGANILIVGFAISGTAPKTLLIRGVGPTLGVFGVTDLLADPFLRLFNSSAVQINQNDDWGGSGSLSSSFASVGAFTLPAASKDAALLVTLAPGSYTAQLSGVNNTTGVALVELYEIP